MTVGRNVLHLTYRTICKSVPSALYCNIGTCYTPVAMAHDNNNLGITIINYASK